MRAIRLPYKVALELRAYLNEAHINDPRQELCGWVAALDRAMAVPRAVKAAKPRKAARAKAHREDMASIRAAVLKRANELCEACHTHAPQVLQIDHAFGGSGRRRALQSMETCWALCPYCHRHKTDNNPGADYWLQVFVDHCWKFARKAASDAEAAGYADAINLARARLESLQFQQAGGMR
jgi:5-methylcytosine-specific restriction endonuclease McrA